MPFITKGMLSRYSQDSSMRFKAREYIVEKASAKRTIFLSHSHKDRALAEGLIVYLGSQGINVYVDWNDKGIPRITNRETANKIKESIDDNSFFLILATDNALSSRWVPWEIDVADQMKKSQRIAIIPIVERDDNEFKGNEYLQLYRCIRLDSVYGGHIKLFEVASSTKMMNVKDWLQG